MQLSARWCAELALGEDSSQIKSVFGDPSAPTIVEIRGGRPVPNRELPQRDPFIGPPTAYRGAPVDVVERFAGAVREWAEQSVHPESSRCRGVGSSGIGRTNGEAS